jgi:hypothetical protein
VATSSTGYAVATWNNWTTYQSTELKGAKLADTATGVSCPTPTYCEAVGSWGTATSAYGVVSGTTNGGKTWKPQHLVTAGGDWPLASVSCGTATHCLAAGVKGGSTNYWTDSTTAGASWTDHLNTVGSGVDGLVGLSCEATGLCVATSAYGPTAMTRDWGAEWTTVTVPSNVKFLWSVSCTSSFCAAVGYSTSNHGTALTSYDYGLNWEPSTVPATVRTLYGVDCWSSYKCRAVGRTGTTDTNGHGVVVSLTGTSNWLTTYSAAKASVLEGIWCKSASWCTAVGGASDSSAVAYTLN